MSEVYRARDTRLGRDVAVKVLPAPFTENTDRLRRFEQEERTTGILNHPSIVVVYDVGTHAAAQRMESRMWRFRQEKRRSKCKINTDKAMRNRHGGFDFSYRC
jgi:serine/threonine protein kinase